MGKTKKNRTPDRGQWTFSRSVSTGDFSASLKEGTVGVAQKSGTAGRPCTVCPPYKVAHLRRSGRRKIVSTHFRENLPYKYSIGIEDDTRQTPPLPVPTNSPYKNTIGFEDDTRRRDPPPFPFKSENLSNFLKFSRKVPKKNLLSTILGTLNLPNVTIVSNAPVMTSVENYF